MSYQVTSTYDTGLKKTVRSIRNPKAKKQKPKEEIKSIGDDFGNIIYFSNNGKRINVSLKLVAEDKRRRIGSINISNKTIQIRRNRYKHLFRKGNAYGFNTFLLSNAKKFDKIRLIDDIDEFLIPVSFVLENGFYLDFKSQGFELQTFININDLYQFKREPKF